MYLDSINNLQGASIELKRVNLQMVIINRRITWSEAHILHNICTTQIKR